MRPTIAEQNQESKTKVEATQSADNGGGPTKDSIRGVVGEGMHSFTEIVNENLVAARFCVSASLLLLSAYGLSNTPLFFRFRTISEVPASYFLGRRRLYGRIIKVDEAQCDRSLQVYIRHLSPVGQILPKAWFDFFMRFSPLAGRLAQTRSKQKAEESETELLRVRIAGIQSPPVSRLAYRPEQFLERLAKQRVLVSCQLLARRVPVVPKDPSPPPKRKMEDVFPELKNDSNDRTHETTIRHISSYNEQQEAICRLSYRPNLLQLFSTDIAETLIAAGNAGVSSSILNSNLDADEMTGGAQQFDMKIVDSSQRISDLRHDVKNLDRLAKTEFEAAKKSMGMWSVPEVRESKREVVEEVEFQSKASIFQKLWRQFRGG